MTKCLHFTIFIFLSLYFHGCTRERENVIYDFIENLPAAKAISGLGAAMAGDKGGRNAIPLVYKTEDTIFQAPSTELNFFLFVPEKYQTQVRHSDQQKNRRQNTLFRL